MISFETLHKLSEGQRRMKAGSKRLKEMKVETSNNLFSTNEAEVSPLLCSGSSFYTAKHQFLRLKGSKFCSDGEQGKEEKKALKQLGVIIVAITLILQHAEHSQFHHPHLRNPRISVHGINTSAVKTPKIHP